MRMLSLLAAALMGSFSAPEVPIQAFKAMGYKPPTKTKKKKGSRTRKYSYGANLLSHFDSRGICWSKKPNKLKRHYGNTHFVNGLIASNKA